MGLKRVFLVALAFLAFPAAASALETNGVAASTYVGGFAVSPNGVGPIGIALDPSGRLFATDAADGWLYRFDGPGTASPGTHLGSAPISANPGGLAFDGGGHLYAARIAERDIVEVDPNTGIIVRTVADGLSCPLAIAVDPTSGDLFATLGCANHLTRISGLSSATPTVSDFAPGMDSQDGLVIDADGTIYVVSGDSIRRISQGADASPPKVSTVAHLPGGDGLAVANSAQGKPTQLLVNRNDGVITRVDLTGGAEPTDVVTGGTRGDFAAVGPDGCLYATQKTSILKVTAPNGHCAGLSPGGLTPSTPQSDTTGATDLPAAAGCLDVRRFTFRLHHGPGTTVVGVDIFVNGARVVHKSGASIATVNLTKLPKKTFRVRVVAFHSNGARIVSTRTYRGCKKSRPHSRHHSRGNHHR